MYTDTKNLANLCANTTAAAAKITNQQQQEDKFKLKKMWKPILRLMSRKSSNASKTHIGSSIPNNINLNNTTPASTNNTPKDLLFTVTENTAAALEDCLSHPAHKLPPFEFTRLQVEQEMESEPTQKELEFISRVSVDKTPLSTCNTCAYGRNCQHHHQNSIATFSAATAVASPITTTHHQHDFNFLQAEDGCFVWSDSTADIDEQLLRQWYWQNAWQFAENATMC